MGAQPCQRQGLIKRTPEEAHKGSVSPLQPTVSSKVKNLESYDGRGSYAGRNFAHQGDPPKERRLVDTLDKFVSQTTAKRPSKMQ